MNIDRTLFWFKDGDEVLISLNEDFFGLAVLLNRLLNDRYDGVKIKFINLDFSTDKTYELHPRIPKNTPYYYGGHLRYYGVFDINEFIGFGKIEQGRFVWEKAYNYLIESAKVIENNKLLEAAGYAYSKGLEMDLNTDYRVLDTYLFISGEQLRASIWITFKEDGMYSKFILERSGGVVFEKELDRSKKGVEFFLEMYKAIEVEDNNIVLKGRKDVEYLPLKIPIYEIPLAHKLIPP